jgi:hypothetical protein
MVKYLLTLVLLFSMVISALAKNINSSDNGLIIIIPRGNGVIVDDVSGDITHTSGPNYTSALLNTLNAHYNIKLGDEFYILPDFMSITQMPKAGLQVAYTNCNNYGKTSPSGKALYNPMNYVINYSSLPLINFDELTDATARKDLGGCIPGSDVTKLYATPIKNGDPQNIVLPMINGSAAEVNMANSATLKTLADDIASVINNDQNASGVSFDLENPSLSSTATTNFIGELAQQLALKGKIVAIYDANLAALAPISNQYHNVIALVSLYGMKGYSAPPKVSDYQTFTTDHVVKAYFGGDGKNIPVLFVSPAAATAELYANQETYNPITSTSTSTSTSTKPNDNCADFDSNTSTILSSILNITPSAFWVECVNAENTLGTSQSEYFMAALNSITSGSGSNNKTLIGTVLYNEKPSGFNAINCAKHNKNYKFLYGAKPKICAVNYPENISTHEWDHLSSWAIPN